MIRRPPRSTLFPYTTLFRSLLPEEADAALRRHFAARGQPGFRAGQVLRWIFEREAFGFDEMTDLPLGERAALGEDRKSTRLNSSHANISYAVFCLKKKKQEP